MGTYIYASIRGKRGVKMHVRHFYCSLRTRRREGVQFSKLFAYVLNVTLLCKKIEEISSTFHTWVMGHVT